MKLLFDRRYPVNSLLLLVTTAVFLSMFIRFGGDYQTGAAVYYSGGVIGEAIQMDQSQLWIVYCHLCSYRPRTFCAQYDHPLLFGTFGRRSLWIESFLSSLSLIRHDGQCLCCYFYARCDCSRIFYSPLLTVWDHWCSALYCPKSLYSPLESVLYQLDCGQFDL